MWHLFFHLGVDLDCYSKSQWLNHDEHEERSAILLDLPVPAETFSYISVVVADC